MSDALQALILGLIQGLTEFLPVSSSGHLVLFQAWLGDAFLFAEEAIAFDLALHVGTLIPVLWFYRKDLDRMIRSLLGGKMAKESPEECANSRRLVAMVVLASVPTAFIGFTFKDTFSELFENVRAVSIALFVTGGVLLLTRKERESHRSIGPLLALIIGTVQGLAITPGISRSGSTIACGLLLGLSRDEAARFSFLISIPAIVGAVLLLTLEGFDQLSVAIGPLILGFGIAMLSGYWALRFLVSLVRRGRLYAFTAYLWPLSIAAWLLS